jgi:hypothetical protein
MTNINSFSRMDGTMYEGRPLPIALARCMARCKPGSDATRLALLNKLYSQMLPVQQLECRRELLEIRAAQAGEREAEVIRWPDEAAQ